MNFIKGMSVSCSAVIMIVLLTGCTPSKAQTRRDDGTYNRYNEKQYNQFAGDARSGSSYNGSRGYTEENSDFAPMEAERGSCQGQEDRYDRTSTAQNRYEDRYGSQSKRNINNLPDEAFYQTGDVSWYGREFHGKVTASGEKFNMYEMTAAHKTLPFGSVVKVRNLDNGREVTVRVNDRGPYRGNRVMDLSYNAAKRLNILASGTGRVGITVLKKGDNHYSSAKNDFDESDRYIEPVVDDRGGKNDYYGNDSDQNISIQAGAFYSRRNADRLQNKIERLTGSRVVVVEDNGLYKVRIEGIRSRSDASRQKRLLEDENIPSFILE